MTGPKILKEESESAATLHVLVVEDERRFASALQQGLAEEGYAVTLAYSGEEALTMVAGSTPDLIVLDVMLPKRDGLSVVRELRRSSIHVPVLLLTALDTVEDRVTGLDSGADDYLTKPFAFSELLARIRALLRRPLVAPQTVLQYSGIQMDLTRHTVNRDGIALELTMREFDILQYLIVNRERIVSREMLMRDIWKANLRYTSLDNLIDVQMVRLRRKVDGPFETRLLQTVRGMGYMLQEKK